MQINDRNKLKEYFKTNKRPTEAQFGDLVDSVALVSEIPLVEVKPFTVASVLLSCDGRRPGRANISFKVLENNLTDLRVDVQLNRIAINSGDMNYEFSLDKTFITVGVLNDTCDFNKVVFSLEESTSKELVLYCESNEKITEEPPVTSFPEGPIIADPDIDLPGTISFDRLPIEIRYYDGLANLIEIDPNLSRYRTYVETKDLMKEDNLLVPPYRFISPDGRRNNEYNGSNTDQDLAIWKQMTDKYLVLPEINTDQEKNPHVYNLKTNEFGCYYTYQKNWLEGSNHSFFLRNSVKKARKAGAAECVVNLGSTLQIGDNIINLKQSLLFGNDKGIKKISLIIDGLISHYTREEFLVI